jgi:hypothetical protein
MIDWERKRVTVRPCSLWAPQWRRSFLSGSELRKQISCVLSLLYLFSSCWLRVCFVPIYVLELLWLQRSSAEVSYYHCASFNSVRFCSFKFNFEILLRTFLLSEVSIHWNFLHSVGSSDRFNRCEEFFRFFRYDYSPPLPLGITKILSIGIRA